jgi:elongation factor P--(R)-beta-lysine ligase
MSWQPNASRETLLARAKLLADIRRFFADKQYLEVETPLLGQHTVTDRYIDSFKVKDRYLQTSPEYAMKRLLAADSGPIFQICKAFRQEEAGRLHNPEFTMLEWYRPGFDHHQLMDEMDALLTEVCSLKKAERDTYQNLFKRYLNIDPLHGDTASLRQKIHTIDSQSLDRDTCLQILFTESIEPHLGQQQPCFVYDYPASQAALSKISPDDPSVCQRFEVYIHGLEIANGFHELTDEKEQQERFLADQQNRRQQNKSVPNIDQRFISALTAGLPNCAGVALGIDRLLLSLTQLDNIKEMLAFSWDNI